MGIHQYCTSKHVCCLEHNLLRIVHKNPGISTFDALNRVAACYGTGFRRLVVSSAQSFIKHNPNIIHSTCT